MPWGWECRAKLVKQVPLKPTERRGGSSTHRPTPAPNQYDTPQLFCGPGVDRIKRAPAYSFGLRTKLFSGAPCPTKNMFNIQCMNKKGGTTRVTHGLVTPHIEPVVVGTKTPGPAVYHPPMDSRRRKPPAYSLQQPARPPYCAFDMWTPPPNMYCPPIPKKVEPAYSFGYPVRILKKAETPGPGEHDPNFKYVIKKKPAFSFGAPFRHLKKPKSPAPNTYCEKKFLVTLRRHPAPSFGIRHSPYIGHHRAWLKSSKLDQALTSN